jgi:transposase InsO family protein
MEKDLKLARQLGVKRFLKGESPTAICASLGKSRFWLYKWVKRFNPNDPDWYHDRSRSPHKKTQKISKEVEEIVKMTRLRLYNADLFFGAQAIRWEMEDLGIRPLPSERTINRILSRNDLTHRRTGRYEPKGVSCPKLPSGKPNQTHQADLVGPRFLKGPIRFYSQNVIDVTTNRSGLEPLHGKDAQNIINGFWSIWMRLGLPENLQVDNALSYFGSNRYPRGMGALIRLCLHLKIDLWFIPMAEPWRNGVIEKFNDHYNQKFLNKVTMGSFDELTMGSLAFEKRHNSRYRYSKLGGMTPLKALSITKMKLRFPTKETPPLHPLRKPDTGRYHFIRFIRSDRKLHIFREKFSLAPELQYEYVVATVDVKEQKLKIFLDNAQVDEFDYKLR